MCSYSDINNHIQETKTMNKNEINQERKAVTMAELVRMIPVTRQTIAKEIKAGRLKNFKIGGRHYFRLTDVEAWIELLETGIAA